MAIENPPPRAPRPAKIGRFKISFNILVQLFVLLLILLMVNYLSFNHYRHWDFTRTHMYSLSEKTKRVVAGLKKPVKIIVFFPANSVISADVNNLLGEYEYASNGKITVEYVDPNRNPARSLELQNTYKFGSQDNIIIIDYDGRKKFIRDRDMVDIGGDDQEQHVTAFKGEQAVTGALLQITDDKPNILYAITGHGEADITGREFGIIKEAIGRENIEVKPLILQQFEAVPKDADLLFISGARLDFSDHDIKLIRDYWEKKGRLFILLDPDAWEQTPNLMAFLADQGISPDNDRIITFERTDVASIAKLVRDVAGNFLDGSRISKNLKGLPAQFMGETQSLTLDDGKAQTEHITLQKLVQAMKGYWGAADYNFQDGQKVPYFNPKKDYGQPLYVAASVEKGGLTTAHVDSSRMVVTGNSQFIKSQYLSAPDIDFTINSIDWLLDREELIGIAPKDYSVLSLNLTDDQLSHVLTFTTFLIPCVAGIFGFALWWKRRH